MYIKNFNTIKKNILLALLLLSAFYSKAEKVYILNCFTPVGRDSLVKLESDLEDNCISCERIGEFPKSEEDEEVSTSKLCCLLDFLSKHQNEATLLYCPEESENIFQLLEVCSSKKKRKEFLQTLSKKYQKLHEERWSGLELSLHKKRIIAFDRFLGVRKVCNCNKELKTYTYQEFLDSVKTVFFTLKKREERIMYCANSAMCYLFARTQTPITKETFEAITSTQMTRKEILEIVRQYFDCEEIIVEKECAPFDSVKLNDRESFILGFYKEVNSRHCELVSCDAMYSYWVKPEGRKQYKRNGPKFGYRSGKSWLQGIGKVTSYNGEDVYRYLSSNREQFYGIFYQLHAKMKYTQ